MFPYSELGVCVVKSLALAKSFETAKVTLPEGIIIESSDRMMLPHNGPI
jgi:hypothetical protein